MATYVQKVMHPEWYHGHGKNPPFFEGWYFKCVDAPENQKWAFIPGIFINEDSSKTHAFIQILDGTNGKAYYHSFPVQYFKAEKDAFDVRIGDSYFSQDSMQFNIDDDIGKLTGELHFKQLNPYPKSFLKPGIMGYFGWFNFLECYHGVVSLDHQIEGNLNIYGTEINFTDGRGYIEKDWGKSFPRGYIWQQSNHFNTVGTSLTASIATIPNFGREFAGFIVTLWHNQQLFEFTTYNGSQVDLVRVDDDTVEWILYNSNYEITMRSNRARGGLLLGPEREAMHKRVDETMQATIEVELYQLMGVRKKLLFKETGRNAGLEVVGDLSLILKS